MPSDSADALRLSFLTPIGYQTSSCGYCKDPTSSASYYASAFKLTTEDYQVLVNRGWRRSGTLLYKPDNRLSCCVQYSIRLPAAEFRCRKDQRSALHRWNRYVLGESYAQEAAKLQPKTKEDKKRQRNDFELSTTVHEAEYSNLSPISEPAHRFEVTLEEDSYTEEKFELFRHYQEHVHHEPASKTRPGGFSRFLCNSPLIRETHHDSVTGKTKALGSYHQMYRLDGRLIAIGVLDLLPNCVSGVYFIYHADFGKYSFGKLSAVREASLALEETYGYYYMGFYIPSSAKMMYKGDYQPQYFLDLDDFNWTKLDADALDLMGRQKYVSVSREARLKKAKDVDPGGGDTSMTGQEPSREGPYLENVREAAASGLSTIQLGLPGVLSAEEIEEQIDLDDVNVQVRKDLITKTSNLVAWENGTLDQPLSLKGIIGEFAACIGPEVMRPDRSVVRLVRD